MKLFWRNTLKKNLALTGEEAEDVTGSLPDMVFSLDANTGRITQCNNTLCDVTGFTKAEVIGRPIFELYHPDCREQVERVFSDFSETGKPQSEELQILLKNGDKCDVSLSATAHRLSSREILYSQAPQRDIEELKQTKQFLYGQNQILEKIARGAALGDSLTALVTLIEQQDPKMICSILLLEEDGVHVRHGAAPRLPAEYIAAIDGQAIGPKAGSCGTAMYRREPVYVEDITFDPLWDDYRSFALASGLKACWSTPIFDKGGEVLGTFAVYYSEPGLPDMPGFRLVDTAASIAAIAISRHHSEVLLERSRIRMANVFEQANDGIYIISANDNRYLDVNPHGAEMLGYSRQELLHMRVADIVAFDEKKRLRPSTERMMAGERHLEEWEHIRKDGSTFLAEVSARRIDEDSCMAIVRDLSERHAAELVLRESEEKLRLFIQYSPSAIAMFDQNMCYLAYSQRWLIDYELGERDLVGLCHYDVFPDLPAHWKDVHKRCLAGSIEKCEEESFVRASGKEEWVRWEIHPWRAASGGIGGIILFSETITRRKQAEEQLRASEQRFRLALEAAHLGIFDWDIASNQIVWSRYHETAWGFLDGEFDGTYEAFAKRIHPDDIEAIDSKAQHCIANRTPFSHEFRIIWPDGSIHWIAARGEMADTAEGEPPRMRGAVVEVTARKLAELELQESNRQLEKLSRKMLSAQEAERRNVARELHDEIGQLLTVVKLDLQTVLHKTGSEALAPALKDGMESIDRVVARVRDLSMNLRPSMLDDLGLAPALRWYVMRQAERLGRGFKVDLKLPPALPFLAEEVQTACFRIAQEAFTNIVRHARAKRILVELAVVDNQLELTVTDDGVGFYAPEPPGFWFAQHAGACRTGWRQP